MDDLQCQRCGTYFDDPQELGCVACPNCGEISPSNEELAAWRKGGEQRRIASVELARSMATDRAQVMLMQDELFTKRDKRFAKWEQGVDDAQIDALEDEMLKTEASAADAVEEHLAAVHTFDMAWEVRRGELRAEGVR